jgi:hypothetical protein
MQFDNPAARLLEILVQGKKRPADEVCRVAWGKVLGTNHGDLALLVSRIGKVMALPQETIDLTTELLPGEPPTWEHWASQVNQAFSVQNLNGQWSTFIGQIDGHTINYLRLSASVLASKAELRTLAPEAITGLRQQVALLLSEVLESEIAPEIKKYVVHHLRKILTCIEEYTITGALPLLDAVESPIGHAYLDEGYKNFLTSTEIGRRVLDTLAATANVVTVAVGIPQLSQVFLQLTGK